MQLHRITLMTMPMQGSDAYDESERTTNVDSYRITCTSFIEDISKDYLAWVDRYDLPKEEDARRRSEIDSIIEKTNHWIFKIAQSIRAIDVVMNDGIQKMAEATAGRPFEIGVFVNGAAGYTVAKPDHDTLQIYARLQVYRYDAIYRNCQSVAGTTASKHATNQSRVEKESSHGVHDYQTWR